MRYIVKSNFPVSGRHWGLDFQNGIAVTERDDLAAKLKRRGYDVTPAEKGHSDPDAGKGDGDASFVCEVCGKAYRSAAALKKHMKAHSQSDEPEDNGQSDEPEA